jgi:putative transposase
MPNPHRLHVPGGTYYVFRSTDSRHPIFSKAEEYARFDGLLPIALRSSDAKLLAYCWLPESVHLVIEIGERPVAEFMRDLMWRYSRTSWHRQDDGRPWFRARYRATVVQPETHLEALIRYVHYLPVRAALATDPDGYPYSSHSAYMLRRRVAYVRTQRLLTLMGCNGCDRSAYIRAMTEAPPASSTAIFEKGLPDTPGIVGDVRVRAQKSTAAATPDPTRPMLLPRLIAHVAEGHDISPEEICSASRRRKLVVVRAQITWLAARFNIASLNEVARHLHHSPSALSRAVTKYRCERPDLFTAEQIGSVRQSSLAPSYGLRW